MSHVGEGGGDQHKKYGGDGRDKADINTGLSKRVISGLSRTNSTRNVCKRGGGIVGIQPLVILYDKT